MILCDLLHGEKSVGELEALLARRQSAVSQQLARLRLEGLVSARRDGKTIYYSIASDKARVDHRRALRYRSATPPAARSSRPQSALRKPLVIAPASVSAAAPQSAISVACAGARPSATATSAVPNDWPISRPEDCRPAAPPLRSRGALPMITRLLGDWKNPKPRPQIASRQASEAGVGIADPKGDEGEARSHHQKPDAAEEAGDESIGQASGDRRDQGGRDRPGRQQQSGGRRRVAEPVLEVKRQRHDGQALRPERGDRRRQRKREHRPAQKIDRQQRRGKLELPPDERHADRRADRDLDQRQRGASALADPVDAGDDEPERERIEEHAQKIEAAGGARRRRQRPRRHHQRQRADRHVDRETANARRRPKGSPPRRSGLRPWPRRPPPPCCRPPGQAARADR